VKAAKKGFYPLDEVLDLSNRKKQWDMQRAGASLAAELPFGKAEELFEELARMKMIDHVMHNVVEDVCEGVDVLDVAPTADEIREKVRKAGEGKEWRPIMVLAMDGVNVPTRPEEAKGKRRGRKKKRAERARWNG